MILDVNGTIMFCSGTMGAGKIPPEENKERSVQQQSTKAKMQFRYKAVLLLFILYLLYLLYLTLFSPFFGRGYFRRSVNFVPLRTVQQYMSGNLPIWIAIVNLLGNVAAFMPMGFLLPMVWKKAAGLGKCLLICAGVSFIIEAAQYVFGVGSADIDDLLLNTVGGLAGYAFYALADLMYKKLIRHAGKQAS